jgi:hypothetical protein
MPIFQIAVCVAIVSGGAVTAATPNAGTIDMLQSARISVKPRVATCAHAAASLREWGWTDVADANATPISSAVRAINNKLRVNAGRLTGADIERLESGAASSDPCVRELSLTVLETQTGDRPPSKVTSRLASAAILM